MWANHMYLKSVTIFLDDNGAMGLNCYGSCYGILALKNLANNWYGILKKKLLWDFEKNYLMEFSTD